MTAFDVSNLVQERFNVVEKLICENAEKAEKFAKQLEKIESEMNTLRTQITVKTRIMTSDNMTPFAQRHPVAGGNKSPQ